VTETIPICVEKCHLVRFALDKVKTMLKFIAAFLLFPVVYMKGKQFFAQMYD
jgi:hypothetical protein